LHTTCPFSVLTGGREHHFLLTSSGFEPFLSFGKGESRVIDFP
jgi:hypothetical protein